MSKQKTNNETLPSASPTSETHSSSVSKKPKKSSDKLSSSESNLAQNTTKNQKKRKLSSSPNSKNKGRAVDVEVSPSSGLRNVVDSSVKSKKKKERNDEDGSGSGSGLCSAGSAAVSKQKPRSSSDSSKSKSQSAPKVGRGRGTAAKQQSSSVSSSSSSSSSSCSTASSSSSSSSLPSTSSLRSSSKRKLKRVSRSKTEELYLKHQKSTEFKRVFKSDRDPDESYKYLLATRSPSITFMYHDRQRHFKFTRDASPETRATELWQSIKPPRGPNGRRKYHFFEKCAGLNHLSGESSDDEPFEESSDYLSDTEESSDDERSKFYEVQDLLKYHMLPGYNYKY